MKKIKNQNGYTIVELLLVMIILGIIASSLIPLFFSSISSNKASKNKLYAYEAAHAEVEEMRGKNFEDLAYYDFFISNLPTATGSVNIDDNIDGQRRDNIVKATVKVEWNFKGKDEKVVLETFIAKKGINQ